MNMVSSPNYDSILSFSCIKSFDVSYIPYERMKHQTKHLVVLFFAL